MGAKQCEIKKRKSLSQGCICPLDTECHSMVVCRQTIALLSSRGRQGPKDVRTSCWGLQRRLEERSSGHDDIKRTPGKLQRSVSAHITCIFLITRK